MFATVEGVRASPPGTGLVRVAQRPPRGEPARWETGLAWVPERCGSDYQLVLWCDPDDPSSYEEPRAGGVWHRPVGVRWAEECSTLGGELDVDRLRRIAEATTPFVIARELWSGDLGSTDSFTVRGEAMTNRWLASTDATTVGSGGAELLPGLGALEQSAMEAARGQQIMLHLPVMLAAELGDYARRVGPAWLTKADNVVVVDGAYPGTGPAGQAVGATAWAYATSSVQVRQSPLHVVAAPDQTVNRSTNTVTAWASRVFAAIWDPCVHLATEITL